MPEVSAESFFSTWCATIEEFLPDLIKDWWSNAHFTKKVLSDDCSVIRCVAQRLGLQCYCEYYKLDAVLFRPSDKVPYAPERETWLRRVRVAFEHENESRSGLYQEVAHLLITDCDHRVLVTYSTDQAHLRAELGRLHDLVSETDRASTLAGSGGLQIIVGSTNAVQDSVLWQSFVYRLDGWFESQVEMKLQPTLPGIPTILETR